MPPGLRWFIQFFTSISGSQYFGRYDAVMQSNFESSLNSSASSSINEILSKEFESLGFYISNHPLKNYEDILKQYNAKLFFDFEKSKN